MADRQYLTGFTLSGYGFRSFSDLLRVSKVVALNWFQIAFKFVYQRNSCRNI
jgi:hypothetical protein